MASFGEELKRERELRDISLKEIAEATKISIRFLEGLEQNNFDILPGGVFNRGFIRAYARFIGVDGEEMVNSYLHELSVTEKKKARDSARGPGQAVKADDAGMAGSTGNFHRPDKRSLRPQEPPGGSSSVGDGPSFKPRLPSDGKPRWTSIMWVAIVAAFLIGGGAMTLNLVGNGEADAAIRQVAPPPESAPSKQDPAPDTAAQDTPADPAPPQPDVHGVWVLATEVNHVRIECGGQVALDQELWPGQSRTVKCKEPALLSALNAGALQYAIDGGPSRLLGEIGERVDGITVVPIRAADASNGEDSLEDR